MVRWVIILAVLLALPTAARADDDNRRGRLGFAAGMILDQWSGLADQPNQGVTLSLDLVRLERIDPWVAFMWGGRARMLHESADSIGGLEFALGFTTFSEGPERPRFEVSATLGVVAGEVRGNGRSEASFGIAYSLRHSIGWNVSRHGSIAVAVEHLGTTSSATWVVFPMNVLVTYGGEWW